VISLIIALILVGAALYLLNLVPMDSRIKTIIYVIVIVGVVIWILRHLSRLGLA
jgi:uncharacterized membrane protein